MVFMYDASFREVYHKIIYIEIKDMAPLEEAIPVIEGATGVLAYGFMEAGSSLSFMVLAAAREENGELELGESVHEEYCRIRYGDIEEYRFMTETELSLKLEDYDAIKSEIAEIFETQDEARKALLALELIDHSRNLQFPEFVSVTLYNGKLAPEMAWARPVRMGEDGQFFGYLSQAPKQKFGLTEQDEIEFRAYDNGQGGIMLMWDGRDESDKN